MEEKCFALKGLMKVIQIQDESFIANNKMQSNKAKSDRKCRIKALNCASSVPLQTQAP